MKKSLVALAAMSVIGAVSAQSSVTLYGLADAYVGSERLGLKGTSVAAPGTNGSTNTVVNSGGQNGSRWGIRVSEDLGGGLAAIAQFESGFNIDTGSQSKANPAGVIKTDPLFGRQAFVGLKSGFGTVALGRQTGPYDDMKVVLSLQGNNGFDATGNGDIGAWQGYAVRVDNSIKFQSNNYSGLSFSAIYGMGEDKTVATSASSTFGIGAMYANGPITVGLVHQNDGTARTTTAPNINGKNEKENTMLAGAYDFGYAKLGGGYNEARVTSAGSSQPKFKEWFLGVSAPLGATTLKAQYARSKQTVAGVSRENDSIGIDAVYDFSKRTSAYVGYNVTTFDAAGALNVGSTTLGDLKNRRFGVGLRHKF